MPYLKDPSRLKPGENEIKKTFQLWFCPGDYYFSDR
jgi:hypothetical protein